ncbi:hypothetical protein VHEMI04273 [[Torrubiella] hemipterigena]|uniref:Ubiquitin-like protein smt3 n=1 Tax=[Torrubiella] hemipterigena TaxID=1531966 RepID=A0A0A1SUV6_9HYPO|nr:hypothetical protein VHEMI04273 [[Torrubiella] hemipterigena]
MSSNPASSAINKAKKQKEEVADSWEDEEVSEDEPVTTINQSQPSEFATPLTSPLPNPPPPTRMSPYDATGGWDSHQSEAPSSSSARNDGRRPEKTDAVARRLIAAGLGLKAPKQTEEQKAYQRSIREQEKKKKDQEKEEEQRRLEEKQKAKAAIWDD